jgi:hypothetical protein
MKKRGFDVALHKNKKEIMLYALNKKRDTDKSEYLKKKKKSNM